MRKPALLKLGEGRWRSGLEARPPACQEAERRVRSGVVARLPGPRRAGNHFTPCGQLPCPSHRNFQLAVTRAGEPSCSLCGTEGQSRLPIRHQEAPKVSTPCPGDPEPPRGTGRCLRKLHRNTASRHAQFTANRVQDVDTDSWCHSLMVLDLEPCRGPEVGTHRGRRPADTTGPVAQTGRST